MRDLDVSPGVSPNPSPTTSPCPSPLPQDDDGCKNDRFNNLSNSEQVKENEGGTNNTVIIPEEKNIIPVIASPINNLEKVDSTVKETDINDKEIEIINESLNTNKIDNHNDENVIQNIKVCINDNEIQDIHQIKTDKIKPHLSPSHAEHHSGIPQRKYSREVQVHYTELLRQITIDERDTDQSLVEGGAEAEPEEDNQPTMIEPSIKTEVALDESADTTTTNDCSTDQTDYNDVVGFDIRDSKISRVTSRKKAVYTDHKSMLMNDGATKQPTRSLSLEVQRRNFILGSLAGTATPRSQSVDSGMLTAEEKTAIEKLPSVSEGDDDVIIDAQDKNEDQTSDIQTVSQVDNKDTSKENETNDLETKPTVVSEIKLDIDNNGAVSKILDENKNISIDSDKLTDSKDMNNDDNIKTNGNTADIPLKKEKSKKKKLLPSNLFKRKPKKRDESAKTANMKHLLEDIDIEKMTINKAENDKKKNKRHETSV